MDQKTTIKTSTPQPIFMNAIQTFGKQEIDVRKIETTPAYARPPWLANKNKTIDLTMCATPKGASTQLVHSLRNDFVK
jgi:hypothetical protein